MQKDTIALHIHMNYKVSGMAKLTGKFHINSCKTPVASQFW